MREVIDRLQPDSIRSENGLVTEEERCPFCGNRYQDELSYEYRVASVGGRESRFCRRVCSCGAAGPDSLTKEHALKLWKERR